MENITVLTGLPVGFVSPKRQRDDCAIIDMFETWTLTDDVVYTVETRSSKEEEETDQSPTLQPDAEEAEDDESEESETADLSVRQFYEKFVHRTAAACAAELAAPQRSPAWLAARAQAITASNFGAAAGHNKHCTPKQLALDKLWSTFRGNEYTQYGTFHEPDARASFMNALAGPLKSTLESIYGGPCKWDLFETGLLKAHHQPWMAVSPDGILRLRPHDEGVSSSDPIRWLLVEYKCPARLRDTDYHPYRAYPHNVPEYYMDQVQGIMGLLNKWPDLLSAAEASVGLDRMGPYKKGPTEAFFVVWQPHQIHVTRVPFDQAYYKDLLEPALEAWYFGMYLPLATLKHNGALVEFTDTAAPPISIENCEV